MAAHEVAEDDFSATEEEFFKAGAALAEQPTAPVESFDDLDDGYAQRGFWRRFFNRPAT